MRTRAEDGCLRAKGRGLRRNRRGRFEANRLEQRDVQRAAGPPGWILTGPSGGSPRKCIGPNPPVGCLRPGSYHKGEKWMRRHTSFASRFKIARTRRLSSAALPAPSSLPFCLLRSAPGDPFTACAPQLAPLGAPVRSRDILGNTETLDTLDDAETGPANTSVSDFWSPELGDNEHLSPPSVVFCYGCPSRPIESRPRVTDTGALVCPSHRGDPRAGSRAGDLPSAGPGCWLSSGVGAKAQLLWKIAWQLLKKLKIG